MKALGLVETYPPIWRRRESACGQASATGSCHVWGEPNLDRQADPRETWNRRYARQSRNSISPSYDPWLDRWWHLLEASSDNLILDLGCGEGLDSRFLTDSEFRVIAVDLSREALKIARQTARQAVLAQADLRDGLPFRNRTFRVIVASLSLHYSLWAQTQRVISGIRACLKPGGYLLARFNSHNDVNFGATGYPIVEPGCYLVEGELKHFFDQGHLDRLFRKRWLVCGLEERVICRHGKSKVIWELAAEKLPD